MADQPNYGFTSGPEAASQAAPQNQGNGLAVAGMVLGIIGLVLCWVPFLSWILAILAIIFGAIGFSKGKKVGKGKGAGLAGLIMGILALVAGVAIFALAIQQAEKEGTFRLHTYGSVTAPEHHVHG